MNERPKTEPSAELRHMASTMWQTYIALVDEGFTEGQALQILGQVLAAAFGKGPSDG